MIEIKCKMIDMERSLCDLKLMGSEDELLTDLGNIMLQVSKKILYSCDTHYEKETFVKKVEELCKEVIRQLRKEVQEDD